MAGLCPAVARPRCARAWSQRPRPYPPGGRGSWGSILRLSAAWGQALHVFHMKTHHQSERKVGGPWGAYSSAEGGSSAAVPPPPPPTAYIYARRWSEDRPERAVCVCVCALRRGCTRRVEGLSFLFIAIRKTPRRAYTQPGGEAPGEGASRARAAWQARAALGSRRTALSCRATIGRYSP